MGAFGFFNYDKPGPGISKDAPQKNTFFVFFETWFRNIWKLIPISCVYILMSVFIIPSGFASAGITNVTRNIARDKHSFGMSDFFETIKKNWKQSLAAGIFNFVVTAVVSLALYFYFNSQGIIGVIGSGVSVAVLFIFAMMKYYIWLILITFKMPLRKIYKNSFYFVFINLKKNLLIGLVSILYYALMVLIFLALQYPLTIALLLMFTVCFFPGFKQLLVQYCVFPCVKKVMIDPYYAEHPNEDIELRRNLGLEVDIPQSQEEESVFSDKQLLPEDQE